MFNKGAVNRYSRTYQELETEAKNDGVDLEKASPALLKYLQSDKFASELKAYKERRAKPQVQATWADKAPKPTQVEFTPNGVKHFHR